MRKCRARCTPRRRASQSRTTRIRCQTRRPPRATSWTAPIPSKPDLWRPAPPQVAKLRRMCSGSTSPAPWCRRSASTATSREAPPATPGWCSCRPPQTITRPSTSRRSRISSPSPQTAPPWFSTRSRAQGRTAAASRSPQVPPSTATCAAFCNCWMPATAHRSPLRRCSTRCACRADGRRSTKRR